MKRKARRWLVGTALAVVLLVGLGYGAILIYANVINDSPDSLDADDLASALDATTTVPAADSISPPDSTSPADSSSPADGARAFSGSWTLTDASVVRYRVDEVLFGVNTTAVGETNRVDGSLTVDGTTVSTATFTVDVASMQSDSGRRDRQFRGRIMETEQFPNARFELTQPIELGRLPRGDRQVQTSATGELSMHGVTNEVTFDLTAETRDDRVGVLGSIPVAFADYDIENPSFGGVTTEDHGEIEFVLVFRRA